MGLTGDCRWRTGAEASKLTLGLEPPREDPATLWEALALPVEWIVFAVLRSLEVVVNVVWEFVVVCAKYVWMTLAAVVDRLLEVTLSGENAIAIRNAVVMAGLFLGIPYVVSWASPSTLFYLRADTSLGAVGYVGMLALARPFGGVCVLLAAASLAFILLA